MIMLTSMVAGFFAGVFAGNGVPHFVQGVTRGTYPCLFGNSSLPNLVAGWASFVVAALLLHVVDFAYELAAEISIALGVLLIGLFHAAGLAFGRN
jgi:hypothetical protein